MDPQALFAGLASYLCIVIIITVHEFGHAVAAVRLGDDTPRLQGRITLNPLAHMDPIGTVVLPLLAMVLGAMGYGIASFIIGWGRPVQFNPSRLRNRQTGPLLIAMAGPFMNVVLAVIAIGLMRLAYLTGANHAALACLTLAELSMFLFFFNLLPIPPLDGSYVLKHLTGMSWEMFQQFSRFGIIVLIIVIQARPVQSFLYSATVKSLSLIARVLGVAPRSHTQLGPPDSNRIVNTDWSYAMRYRETHGLRERLSAGLATLGWDVLPGIANFLLCHLPADGPDAETVVRVCRERGLFLRNAALMGSQLGPRTIRIAVKDAATNALIVAILREVLTRLTQPRGAPQIRDHSNSSTQRALV